MGYELNRLMQLYGVPSPALAYLGMNAPIKPEADMVAHRDGTQERIPFSELQAKYDADLANYNASQQMFKDYSQAYRDRIASTPMYSQPQFGGQVTARPALSAPVYASAQLPNLSNVLRESQLKTASAPASQAVKFGNTGGGYDFSSGYQNLGDAPDAGTMGGGGYGTDADGGGYGTDADGGGVGFGGSDSGDSGSDGGDSGGGYCIGGLVKKYAEGGEVDMGDPNQGPQTLPPLAGGANLTPGLAELIRRDAAVQGITNPVADFSGAPKGAKFGLAPANAAGSAAAASEPGTDLTAILAKYDQVPSPYAEELKTARARSDKEAEAFTQMVNKLAANPESAGPSKAEMYFRLAAAFGSPTKTGSFMENAGLAANEMAGYQKDVRSAQSAARQQQLQMMLEAQKMRMTGAREDLATTRQLAAQEAQQRSGFNRDLLKEYLVSGRPQSEAGKAALDAGFTKGSPEFNKFVSDYVTKKLEGGDLLKLMGLNIQQQGLDIKKAESAKLTPAELKLKTESEDTVASLDSALQDLDRAYKLNPNTFGNTLIEQAQRKALQEAGVKDPKLSNTTEVENLLGQQALSKLRTTFGGNPTEGERAILLDLEGAGSKTPEDRAMIIRRAYKAAKERRAREEKRLNEIKAGLYRSTDTTSNLGE